MSMENRATRRSRRKPQARRPALSPWSENTPHAPVTPTNRHCYQDECFTPRRVLKRTPPPSPARLSPPLESMPAVSCKDNTTSQTFSKRDTHGNNTLQQLRVKPRKEHEESTTTKGEVLGVSNARHVQHECFTPRRTLKRTPPQKQFTSKNPVASKQTGRGPSHPGRGILDSSVAKDMIDLVPPPPRWEIPRTPVITAASTQERVVTTERGGGCSEEPQPLLKPAQGSTDPVASNDPQTLQIPTMLMSEGVTEDGNEGLHHGNTSVELVGLTSPPVMGDISNQPAVVSPPIISNRPAVSPPIISNRPAVSPPIISNQPAVSPPIISNQPAVSPPIISNQPAVSPPIISSQPAVSPPIISNQPAVSPPIISNQPAVSPPIISSQPAVSPPISTAHKGVLPGLVCTENDLAYLQRTKNIKQYEELQSQMVHLDRALKSAAEQKEQLQHKALKINSDLVDMRARYVETVSTIHTLISNPSTVLTSSSSPLTPPPPDTAQQPTQAHVAQLKRMNQLTATQLEKMGREVKGRMAEISREKEETVMKLTEFEQTNKTKEELFNTQHKTIEERREKLEAQMHQASKEHASMENELAALQLQLAKMRTSQAGEEDTTDQEPLREKQKAEERLQRIIRRCELYVRRHQMLKEMGIRGRRGH